MKWTLRKIYYLLTIIPVATVVLMLLLARIPSIPTWLIVVFVVLSASVNTYISYTYGKCPKCGTALFSFSGFTPRNLKSCPHCNTTIRWDDEIKKK